MMKFIIEPINDTDCRITDIDCSGLHGQAVGELTIPATVEQNGKTYQVKEVGPHVCFTWKGDRNTAKFAAISRLKKIIVSEGIEVIDGLMDPVEYGSNAEERGNAEYLAEVVLPSTLKKIGQNSFRCNKALSKINIPEGVEEIEKNAFHTCESLSVFQWPKSLKKVDLSAFFGMSYPVDENNNPKFILEIPDTIEAIEDTISYLEFAECKVSTKAWEIFDSSNLPGIIRAIDIPEGVKRVAGQYDSLRRLSLPSSLEEIGEAVFKDSCHALDYITELPAGLKVIGEGAFEHAYNSDEPKEIRIPSPDVKIGRNAFKSSKGNIMLTGDEATMKSLMAQPGALNGTNVKEINIPEGATVVDVESCPELVRLTIPSTVTSINSISNCPKLENLEIPDSVTEINRIYKLQSLETIKLSSNLKKISELRDCSVLKELVLPNSLTEIGERGFYKLKAEIKASVKTWNLICSTTEALRAYAPESGEVTIPEGVEMIAEDVFVGSEITAIYIPASVKEIKRSAFSGCKSLTSVTFAEGSQLQSIGKEAFNKTAIRQLTLPAGFTTLGTEAFKDIETLDSVTFPASMTDYGFGKNMWGNMSTPFVRCKNLKYVVFLADDPATAVYPVALGKLCDWYVPDNMVEHAKAFIEKAKADNPDVKGVGAKSVKPLSKLTGGKPEAKKKAPAKKKDALTQAIRMHTLLEKIIYRFPVAEEDIHMLDNGVDLALLATRYLREKTGECSFEIIDRARRGFGYTVEELTLDTAVNSATEKQWHSTPKTTLQLDFENADSLPEDFPVALAPELAKAGGFKDLYALRCSNFGKELAEGAPAYLTVKLGVSVVFDFTIGEKEKFNIKKITVMNDWNCNAGSRRCWRFGLIYNGRYIPASAVAGYESDNSFILSVAASKDRDGKEVIDIPNDTIDSARFSIETYNTATLPFVNEILSLVK